MKILIGTDRVLYGSGIGRVVEEMARCLYEKGYDVKIVCGKCNIKSKVPVILCKYNETLYQTNILDIIKTIKREEPDIFHSHYYPMDVCGAFINSSKTKHIMHSHGVNHQSWRLSWKNPLSLVRADIGEFLGLHFSEKIICVSNYMKNALIRKHRIEKSKIEVVYNGVNLQKFNLSIKGDEIRERYGINHDDIVLLCVSALTPRKGQDLLIDCMRIVTKKIQNIKLLLVGSVGKTTIQYKQILRYMVRNAGLEKYVIFCGHIPDEELPKYYAASDIYVSASTWESFGLPFVEAMACGRPAIGFDKTAISELIIDGYNGYKVKYPDINELAIKIIHLANDVEKRKIFGLNGRKFVEKNFDVRRNIKKIIRIYSQLL
ncbi:Glycosyltransferase [Archaeoglobus sulfaticallidus PM70-1]|uniref:Glycosyltransferase n=1 Tax=Archaeoglobus sulfaticallidus PM70-1 TaxID=387631 RepID=N0BI16_9EURY|nr:glycosyltransferase family 4 protein [Archaeoglobus sulfaticallidus]AGK60076.1 Glycosyltransferase [Archaeoglobus sulfaticallidus PM70-1]